MKKGGVTRSRWKQMPNGWRATCAAPGCTRITRDYCRRAECGLPHCTDQKGPHIIEAHRKPLLAQSARWLGIRDDHRLSLEALGLLAQIHKQSRVTSAAIVSRGEGAHMVEVCGAGGQRRSTICAHVEQGLHTVLTELRSQPFGHAKSKNGASV